MKCPSTMIPFFLCAPLCPLWFKVLVFRFRRFRQSRETHVAQPRASVCAAFACLGIKCPSTMIPFFLCAPLCPLWFEVLFFRWRRFRQSRETHVAQPRASVLAPRSRALLYSVL